MDKKKIVICSDSLQHISGLGKTALRIAKGFYESGEYDVSYFVITGQDTDKSCFPFYGEDYANIFDHMSIYNCQIMDPNKYKLFDDYIFQEKPDIVYSLIDPWNLDQIQFSSMRSTFYWVAHCLFETPYYPEHVMMHSVFTPTSPRKSVFDPLRNADLVIPVTKMGEHVLDRASVKHGSNIYLGIDSDKRCKEAFTKQQVFGHTVNNDDVLFMTVGRNSERKKLDKVIEVFSLFVKNRKIDNDTTKYKLYMHTDFNEAVGGTDLIDLCSELGAIDDVMFPINFIKNEFMSDEDLYKRYSVCDAYIEMSAGEGFCYPIVESLLHNKPVLFLNYGGHAEYCNQFGYAVRPDDFYCARNINMKWALPHLGDAVRGMTSVLEQREEMNSFDFVKATFDWDEVIMPKLINVIEQNYSPKQKLNFKVRKII